MRIPYVLMILLLVAAMATIGAVSAPVSTPSFDAPPVKRPPFHAPFFHAPPVDTPPIEMPPFDFRYAESPPRLQALD